MKKLFISFILICFLVSNASALVVGYSRTFGAAPSYLFSWIATDTTAQTSAADITATTSGTPTISTDQFESAPSSMKADTANYRYIFTRSDLMNTVSGTVTLYLYGNYTDGVDQYFGNFYGDASNYFELRSISADRFQVRFVVSGVSTYVTAATTLTSSVMNKLSFTYDGSSGTNTSFSVSVNDGTAGTDSTANIWNVAVPFAEVRLGSVTGTGPTSPFYIDDVLVE